MSIYQHFRPEEKEFIDQVLTWKSYVEMNYAPKLTDFLDPREQLLFNPLLVIMENVRFNFSVEFKVRNVNARFYIQIIFNQMKKNFKFNYLKFIIQKNLLQLPIRKF